MDEQTVFVRTEAGQQAVRDPDVDLPRVLRALLYSIDGRSTAGSYATLLSNFGDVYAQLALLHEAGYLRERKSQRLLLPSGLPAESTATASRYDSRPSHLSSTPFNNGQQPDTLPQDSRWAASQQVLPPFVPVVNASAGVGGLLRKMFRRKSRDANGATAWGHSQQFAASTLHESNSLLREGTRSEPMTSRSPAGPATVAPIAGLPAMPPPPARAPVPSDAERLQAARALMVDFMHLYLPAIAQEASMSIQALQTREQMVAGLPDYSQLVSRTGDAGRAHLAQLQMTLGLTQ